MRQETYGDYCQRLSDVLNYVHDHLNQSLGVQELSTIGCMSPFHFQRVFSKLVGENCVQLVRRLRLERAAWQLQNTEKPIAEIAFDAEFESQEAFARAFRTSFGSPATSFRFARWSDFHLLAPSRFHFTPEGRPRFEPLTMFGEGLPFELREIPSFELASRQHVGAPHLVAKSARELVVSLESVGFDLDVHPVATYAYGLRPGQAVKDITTFVAAPQEFASHEGLELARLGGGLHLVVIHNGPGADIGDLWFRIWAEAFPASGATLREEPCFQIMRFDLSAPSDIHATICIPVSI
ncbi:MAG: AraC family transcriptional regulator [Armatimonadetes bacterium]|nr:AraC family transcriptional regulator [Armatimonadota bacterium]